MLLPSRERLKFQLGWETQLNYQMQAQGRALLWAGKRAPDAHLAVELPREPLLRSALPTEAARVTWARMPPGTKIRMVLRR